MERGIRILSEDEIVTGARRVRDRSHTPLEDLALYLILFATGARPLEIARLEVHDYLDAAGCIRRASTVREEVAITSRARPLHFRSTRLDAALDAYLADRIRSGVGVGVEGQYRGLNPRGRLFLSTTGKGFQITPCGQEGQKRFCCRGIQETYRKVLRYAELEHVTALTARHTVAARLYERGANESQVGLLLGIAERSAVREQFPRPQHTLGELVIDLV